MSTSIGNGFIIEGDISFARIGAACIALQAALKPLAAGECMRTFVASAIRELDKRSCGLSPETAPILRHVAGIAHDEILEARRNKGELPSQYDVETDLVFYPLDEDRALFTFWSKNRWTDEVLRIPGVRSYAWWNGSDRPNGIAEAEWDAREADWKKVMAADGIFHNGGFKRRIVEAMGPPRIDRVTQADIDGHAPKHAVRIRQIAQEIVLHRLFHGDHRKVISAFTSLTDRLLPMVRDEEAWVGPKIAEAVNLQDLLPTVEAA